MLYNYKVESFLIYLYILATCLRVLPSPALTTPSDNLTNRVRTCPNGKLGMRVNTFDLQSCQDKHQAIIKRYTQQETGSFLQEPTTCPTVFQPDKSLPH